MRWDEVSNVVKSGEGGVLLVVSCKGMVPGIVY